jgi:hypothetical protein
MYLPLPGLMISFIWNDALKCLKQWSNSVICALKDAKTTVVFHPFPSRRITDRFPQNVKYHIRCHLSSDSHKFLLSEDGTTFYLFVKVSLRSIWTIYIQYDSLIFTHLSSVYCISPKLRKFFLFIWLDRELITLSNCTFSIRFISHLN